MISLAYPLPPSEYPSVDVPNGWYLLEFRGLDDLVALVWCTPTDWPRIEAGEWRGSIPLNPFNPTGNSVIAFVCAANGAPDTMTIERIVTHVRADPREPLLMPFPSSIIPKVIPFKEPA